MPDRKIAPPASAMLAAARAAGGERVQRREGLAFGARSFDIYEPADAAAPTVLIVFAMADSVLAPRLGSAMKDTPHLQAWGRWLAASGIRAVVPACEDPATDMPALWRHLQANAAELGIDPLRLGVVAWSGHGPLACALCRVPAEGDPPAPRCLALLYAYGMDRAGSTAVADTVRGYGMAVPQPTCTLADLPADLPLFIARAGRDAFANLNAALDALVADALADNRAVTLVNLPEAAHAFDLQPPTPDVLRCLRALVDFLRASLAG